MSDTVEVIRHDKIVEVALNRPEAYNALNIEMILLLAQHLTPLAKDKAVKGIVISGKGKAFCAGGDLKWIAEYPAGAGPAFHLLASRFHIAIQEIRRMQKPVVAAINGIAAGAGFSLSLSADFRVMEKSASLRQIYTSHGLSIDGGGTFMLPRLVGFARALEIAAFDEPISSEQALDWGLVTKVVENGKAVEEGIEMIHRIAKGSLHSFGWSKKLLTDSFDTSFESHINRERDGISDCGDHPEGQEGINAFIKKRKPRYGL